MKNSENEGKSGFNKLGAFIGSFSKVIDYWFSDGEKDKVLFQKMDEEDGEALSNTNNT